MNHREMMAFANGLAEMIRDMCPAPAIREQMTASIVSRLLLDERLTGTYWTLSDMHEVAVDEIGRPLTYVEENRLMELLAWRQLDEKIATLLEDHMAALVHEVSNQAALAEGDDDE